MFIRLLLAASLLLLLPVSALAKDKGKGDPPGRSRGAYEDLGGVREAPEGMQAKGRNKVRGEEGDSESDSESDAKDRKAKKAKKEKKAKKAKAKKAKRGDDSDAESDSEVGKARKEKSNAARERLTKEEREQLREEEGPGVFGRMRRFFGWERSAERRSEQGAAKERATEQERGPGERPESGR